MKIYLSYIQKQSILVTSAFLFWEVLVILLNWANKTGGAYIHFLHTIFLVFGILSAFIGLERVRRKEVVNFKVYFVNAAVMTLIVAFVYTAITLLLYTQIIPSYIDTVISEKLSMLMDDRNITQEVVDREIAGLHKRYSFAGIIVTNLGLTTGIGVLVSAFLSGVFSMRSIE